MSSLLLPSYLFISRRTLSSSLRLRSNPNPNPNPNPNSRFRSLSVSAKMEDASSIPSSAAVANGGSAPGSAAGSLKAEGILNGGSALAVDPAVDAEFGFGRAEFRKDPLVATAGPAYDRHVFLCYKSPESWPSHLEAADSDRLPRLLSAALKARKDDMAKRTRLTICGGEDGTESSNGDVLIFPDMIRYRQLTHFDIDNFVEEVLVKDTEWLPGSVEKLTGSYVFICAHGSRDRRCGVCAPPLIKKFEEEIKSRGLQGQVSVSPCSHVGGHKYSGNAIIFSRNMKGEVTGHWYGYVSPDDVPALVDQHIGKGEIIDHLWRGQMGLSAEEQKEALNLRKEKIAKTGVESVANGGGCCQGIGGSACCQTIQAEKPEDKQAGVEKTVAPKKSNTERNSSSNKGACVHKPTWFESWEREDTYAALAVVAAIASVAAAFSYYRQLR